MKVFILWRLKADKHCVSHMCCLLPAYLNICVILINGTFIAKLQFLVLFRDNLFVVYERYEG